MRQHRGSTSAFINPIFDRVEDGAPATDDSPRRSRPATTPRRDMLNLVHTLESLSAASCQALVPQVTEPALRAEAMQIGVRSARQAALMALRINPGGYVAVADADSAQPAAPPTTVAPTTTQNIAAPTAAPPAEAPPQTEIPLPVAIPASSARSPPITLHRWRRRRERCAAEAQLRDAQPQLVRLPVLTPAR